MANKLIQDSISKEINKSNEKYKGKSAAYLASLRARLRHAKAGLCRIGMCKEPGPICPKHKEYEKRKNRESYLRRHHA